MQRHPAASPTAARHLRVRVTDDGRPKVDLTLPAAATAALADLVPPDLEERLRADGVDVGAIAVGAVSRGFPPGELFVSVAGARQVRVWLE